jgi:hypothetical protein
VMKFLAVLTERLLKLKPSEHSIDCEGEIYLSVLLEVTSHIYVYIIFPSTTEVTNNTPHQSVGLLLNTFEIHRKPVGIEINVSCDLHGIEAVV